jgi:hypothetical protein
MGVQVFTSYTHMCMVLFCPNHILCIAILNLKVVMHIGRNIDKRFGLKDSRCLDFAEVKMNNSNNNRLDRSIAF